jgi:hypothetical protein
VNIAKVAAQPSTPRSSKRPGLANGLSVQNELQQTNNGNHQANNYPKSPTTVLANQRKRKREAGGSSKSITPTPLSKSRSRQSECLPTLF